MTAPSTRKAALRPAVVGVVLALLTLLLFGANLARARREPPGMKVTVETVRRSTLEATVNATGTLRPGEESRLRSPLTGTVELVLAGEGDSVEEGQVLVEYQRDTLQTSVRESWLRLVEARARLAALQREAQFEAELFARELEQAAARLRQARGSHEEVRGLPPWDLRRAQSEESLNQVQAEYDLLVLRQEIRKVAPESLEAARAAVTVAEGAYRASLEQLERTVVVSPIGGVVTAVQVEPGTPVSAGALLLTVADLGRVRAEVRVDELDVGLVVAGQPAAVCAGGFIDRAFPGTVIQVAPVAEMEGRAARFRVTILVDNAEGLLRPGMTVDAHITVERAENVLSVPLHALLREGEDGWVLALRDGTAQRLPVTAGIQSATRVEIREGLVEGLEVITGPLHLLDRLVPGDRAWREDRP